MIRSHGLAILTNVCRIFQVPREGNTCMVTVSLGWGNEPLDKQVKMFHRSAGGILS